MASHVSPEDFSPIWLKMLFQSRNVAAVGVNSRECVQATNDEVRATRTTSLKIRTSTITLPGELLPRKKVVGVISLKP
jgi:hypothetical protein